MPEDKLTSLTHDLTDDEILSLLSFIPDYDPNELHRLGDFDPIALDLSGIVPRDDLSLMERLSSGAEGEKIFSNLSGIYRSLNEVIELIRQPETRSEQVTWNKLDNLLQRYSSTMLLYGGDSCHYGSTLALNAVHPTSYYQKSWKLAALDEKQWDEILDSLEDLKAGLYHASIGNMDAELDRSERAGITLERILRGNTIAPLPRYFTSEYREEPDASANDLPSLVPSEFAETGSTSSLKQMFPFFHYWSEKAEEFVNSEKTVNIEMNVSKFFEDLNVTMEDKSDISELEDTILKVLNRALSIAQSAAD